MVLILGFLTLPLPAPSAKSILQSSSPSHTPTAPAKQIPHSALLVVSRRAGTRCSLVVAPRIRAVRLESLPRARRGGPSYPARKPIRFAISDARRTHKSVCPLLPGCAEGHRSSLPSAPGIVDCDSLAIFSWCSQAITSMLRKRPQALWPRSRNITLLTEIEMPP